MTTIKYYPLDDLRFTPFGNPKEGDNFKDYKSWNNYLRQQGIIETNNEQEADLYITQHFPIYTKSDLYLWRLKHRYIPVLVWTHEPRYCNITTTVFPKRFYKPEIHVMDVFTDDVYLTPFTWFGSEIKGILQYADNNHFETRKRKICVLGTYRPNFEYFINGVNIDLSELRQKIALFGYSQNMVDICGRFWPQHVKTIKTDRCAPDWHQTKMDFIKQYLFNLCIENTNYKYYITEKIWDSITAGCLPIYYGTSYIYELFPKNSFIDVNNYNSFESLFNYIKSINKDDYLERLNKCIETYNHIYQTIDIKQQVYNAIDKVIERIHSIVKK